MDETEVGISILLKLLHRKKLSYLLSGIGGGVKLGIIIQKIIVKCCALLYIFANAHIINYNTKYNTSIFSKNR